MRRNVLVIVIAAGLLMWCAIPGSAGVIISGETKKYTQSPKADTKATQQELQASIESGNVISIQKFKEGIKDGLKIEEKDSPEKLDASNQPKADTGTHRKGRLIPTPVSRK